MKFELKKPELKLYTGNLKRDRFHISFFICNYIGFSFRIFGWGGTFQWQIQKP